MTIRGKLFAFILPLVVLMNLVNFVIYESGKTIQSNYSLMMERVLLFKQITNATEDNVRHLNGYLINPNQAAFLDFSDKKKELKGLKDKLESQGRSKTYAAAAKYFGNMVGTFLDEEDAIIGLLYRTDIQNYGPQFDEMEKTAGYIQEEGQRLIDLELAYYQPLYKQMLLETSRMNGLGVSLMLANLLFSTIFTIWLARTITAPIAGLVHVADQISKGNLDVVPPPILQGDEMGILTKAFRQMLYNLNELMAKNREMAEKDRLVKELEIKALQSQINPHFLFNTLNALSKLALLEGAEKTSDLTVSVSNMMRYNLRKLDMPVTLRDELEHVREYFRIQQARFRDRISYAQEIDESLLDLPIPSLTLQPILENAFVHGIEGLEQGAEIRLSIRRVGAYAVIAVSDNGAGMPEEVRLSLLQFSDGFPAPGQKQGKSTGLGTRNVYRRIQLFYGEDDLVGIRSNPGKGTTVTLRIPVTMERGEDHVSAVDSGR
jgi:sensor histidine kinase YesM